MGVQFSLNTIAGDVDGNLLSCVVEALQGIAVKDGTPANGDVLTYVAVDSMWEPQPGGASGVSSVNSQVGALSITSPDSSVTVGSLGPGSITLETTGGGSSFPIPNNTQAIWSASDANGDSYVEMTSGNNLLIVNGNTDGGVTVSIFDNFNSAMTLAHFSGLPNVHLYDNSGLPGGNDLGFNGPGTVAYQGDFSMISLVDQAGNYFKTFNDYQDGYERDIEISDGTDKITWSKLNGGLILTSPTVTLSASTQVNLDTPIVALPFGSEIEWTPSSGNPSVMLLAAGNMLSILNHNTGGSSGILISEDNIGNTIELNGGAGVSVQDQANSSVILDGVGTARVHAVTSITLNSATINATTGGDVSGSTLGAITVTKIRGNSVKSVAPNNGDLLTWVTANSDWEPLPSGALAYTSSAPVVLNYPSDFTPVVFSSGVLDTGNPIVIAAVRLNKTPQPNTQVSTICGVELNTLALATSPTITIGLATSNSDLLNPGDDITASTYTIIAQSQYQNGTDWGYSAIVHLVTSATVTAAAMATQSSIYLFVASTTLTGTDSFTADGTFANCSEFLGDGSA